MCLTSSLDHTVKAYYKAAPLIYFDAETNILQFYAPGVLSSSVEIAALVGCYLQVVAGENAPDPTTCFKIVAASVGESHGNVPGFGKLPSVIDVQLRENPGIPAFSNEFYSTGYPIQYLLAPTQNDRISEDVWYIKIAKREQTFQLSTQRTLGLWTSYSDADGVIDGQDPIYTYSDSTKTYSNMSRFLDEVSTDNTTASFKSPRTLEDSGITYFDRAPFKELGLPPGLTSSLTNRENMFDFKRSTYASIGAGGPFSVHSGHWEGGIYQWKIALYPESPAYDDFESLYFGVDFQMLGASMEHRYSITFGVMDIFGVVSEEESEKLVYPAADVSNGWLDRGTDYYNFIPNDIYSVTGANTEDSIFGTFGNAVSLHSGGYELLDLPTDPQINGDLLELPSTVLEKVKLGIPQIIIATLRVESGGTTFAWDGVRIKQVTVFGKKKIESLSEDVYATIRGEIGPISNTTSPQTWWTTLMQTGVTERHFPSVYPLGALATIMKYTKDNRISYDVELLSQDTSEYLKQTIGRAITDKTSTFELLRKLAQTHNIGIFTNRAGVTSAKSFVAYERLDGSPDTSHTLSPSTCLRDSIKDIATLSRDKSPAGYLYTFGWDEGLQKYQHSVGVQNVDAAAFPDEADTAGIEAFMPGWRYSEHLFGPTYTEMKAVWEEAHARYLALGAATTLPKQNAELYLAPDFYKLLSPDTVPFICNVNGGYEEGTSIATKYIPPIWPHEVPRYLHSLFKSWAGLEKYTTEVEVPITSTTIKYDLLDRVKFTFETGGVVRDGRITKVQIDPKRMTMKLGLIVFDEGLASSPTYIHDLGVDGTDISYIERGASFTEDTIIVEEGI
jgi:hypothetical protein